MKNSVLTCLFCTVFVFTTILSLSATNPISINAFELTIDMNKSQVTQLSKDLHQRSKLAKFFSLAKKKIKSTFFQLKSIFYQVAGIFDDPIEKWLYLSIISGIIAIIFFFLTIYALLGGLSVALADPFSIGLIIAGLFSLACFIIYLVKVLAK